MERARGGHPTGRPRTSRQYSGSGTAVESNARYRQLIARGTRDLSVAFDLPTQRGHDSDTPLARGEVGRSGVAIDSVDDMRVLFRGIPLDEVSTSMTISAPAAPLLLLYQLVAEEQGVPAARLTGTTHNEVLTEHSGCGTYVFPPKPPPRLTADVFRYCRAEIPRWNPLSISGRRLADAGASSAQEIAFLLADGLHYVRTAVAAGIDVDDFAPRLSFFFAARGTRTTIFEEVAKSRAARSIWARAMRAEFGTRSRKSLRPNFRTPAYEQGEAEPYPPLWVDPAIEARQAERLAKLRASRCRERVDPALLSMRRAAEGDDNVLYPMKEALAAGATVGEVWDTLRGVWGMYIF